MPLVTWVQWSRDAVEPSCPAASVLHIAAGIEACGGPKAEFMAEVGVSADELTEPERRMAFADFARLVVRATELTPASPLILAVGFGASVSRYGTVGFAAMTEPTLREAIQTTVRFAPLISSAAGFQLDVHDGIASFELVEVYPMGEARGFIAAAVLISLWHIAENLTGSRLVGDVEFAFPEPPGIREHLTLAPGRVDFGRARHRLLFDPAYLDLPLLTADASTARATRGQCERALSELAPEAGLIRQVSAAIFAADGCNVQSAPEVARSLGMSERSLKRKLAEQGTSYSELLDHTRQRLATELLRTAASIDEVAARLGYSDPANFTRAFRRWTGQSPRAARSSVSVRA